MWNPYEERWPPIYDAEGLAKAIDEILGSETLASRFYTARLDDPAICQGDVVELRSPLPLIEHDGEAVAFGDFTYWMVIGNTCDFDRGVDEVTWSQIVPLIDLGEDDEIEAAAMDALRRYRYARRFYVPPWPGAPDRRHRVADFLRPVTIHKTALRQSAAVRARLDLAAWVLLHSCLVRFLARDDGRFDRAPEGE